MADANNLQEPPFRFIGSRGVAEEAAARDEGLTQM